jgi:hypothetical protein
VTIFASGAGGLNSSLPEGSIPSQPVGGPVMPVAVTLNSRSLEALYAGNAPGLVVYKSAAGRSGGIHFDGKAVSQPQLLPAPDLRPPPTAQEI